MLCDSINSGILGHVDIKKREDTTTYPPYFNREEFEPVNKMKNCPEKIQSLKAMADAGNIQAAYVYGDMLMIGSWDIKRMELDLTLGQLLPSPTNILNDPYLILPRNQNYAIEYLKAAANFPNENVCVEISKARAQLNYCRLKANIGYYGYGKIDQFMIEEFYRNIDENATAQDKLLNPFLPWPYERPNVENPKTKVFERVAFLMNTAVLVLVLLYHIVAFYSILPILTNGRCIMVIEVFTFFAFTIPIIIAVIANKISGSERLPCSCPEIRKAYDVSIADLPKNLKQEDPFEKTPSISKYIISIVLALFGTYAIAAIIFGLLKLTNTFDITKFFSIISGGVFYSIVFVSIAYPIMTILMFKNMATSFTDRICDRILQELEVKNNLFDMLAESLCNNN